MNKAGTPIKHSASINLEKSAPNSIKLNIYMVVIYPTTPVVEFTSYMLTWTSLPESYLCTRTETFPQKLKEVLLVE
jgi:hypothetical protein